MNLLSDENISVIKECLDWDIITKYKINNNELTISFIRKFKDCVNWMYITHHKLNTESLTNDFILEPVKKVFSLFCSLIKDVLGINTLPLVLLKLEVVK